LHANANRQSDPAQLRVEVLGRSEHSSGEGLNDGTEHGWDPLWNANVPLDSTAAQSCIPDVWTTRSGPDDGLPINCINWYQAYAFCIWDGAFLPSEAEWNYAASGGEQQRVYPWSAPATSSAIACEDANYSGCSRNTMPIWKGGSASPHGDGRWGQADLAGNLQEWVLDAYGIYAHFCNDCAALPMAGDADAILVSVTRGGSYSDVASSLVTSQRRSALATQGTSLTGARCARSP
jgi:formylglycine-generating enzyme required for sulfatase activity